MTNNAGTARSLTIMQVLPALEGGGVERGTLEVAHELVKRGHRSIVISAGGRLVDELLKGGSEHIHLGVGRKSLRTLAVIPRFRALVRDIKPNVLHLRSRLPAWVARFAIGRLSTRPAIVTTVHGLYSVSRYSAIMTRADAVIAVSDTVKRYLVENYPAMDHSIVKTIYRGVDPHEFPYGHRPTDGWFRKWYNDYPMLKAAQDEGGGVLTLAGRISRGKGHLDFIELMSRLKQTTPNAWGLIVGNEDPKHGNYANELRSLIQQRGANVLMIGHRSDIQDVYAASRIVLSLSSKPESFGRTVLEALSLGVPVVGYDHGGVGEVLRTILPQGLVPRGKPGTMDRLVSLVQQWLESPPAVPQQTQYLKSHMLDATIRLYDTLAW
ncbi:MAG TPA: glycosyltransferase family 4 protein [Phycisphaerales bacterium]|nr:glycosyltransferase family 4 protein [Phycisphaerales bacterium]HRQ75271.1 glycosyltransferase family 4 protein [Phycisphaerales bacterium]